MLKRIIYIHSKVFLRKKWGTSKIKPTEIILYTILEEKS